MGKKEAMNIYAKKGDKVVVSNLTAGYEHDQQVAKNHLNIGEVYTVERTVVHSWYTDVYLLEIPGVKFNSVFFKDKNPVKTTIVLKQKSKWTNYFALPGILGILFCIINLFAKYTLPFSVWWVFGVSLLLFVIGTSIGTTKTLEISRTDNGEEAR